jgi:hypothetical protein
LLPEQAAASAMVAEARERGLELTGPNGSLKLFTKNVLETALNEEMTEHLGHEKNQAEAGRESTNVRNGARPKIVVSDAAGEVQIGVPQDRQGTFKPRSVADCVMWWVLSHRHDHIVDHVGRVRLWSSYCRICRICQSRLLSSAAASWCCRAGCGQRQRDVAGAGSGRAEFMACP